MLSKNSLSNPSPSCGSNHSPAPPFVGGSSLLRWSVSSSIGVIPRDGVRQRFHAVLGVRRLYLALVRDGFAAEHPLRVARVLDRLAFTLESRRPRAARSHDGH